MNEHFTAHTVFVDHNGRNDIYMWSEFKNFKQKLYVTFNVYLIFRVVPEVRNKNSFENRCLKVNEYLKLYSIALYLVKRDENIMDNGYRTFIKYFTRTDKVEEKENKNNK
jgi:hypothetical protein